MTWSPDRIARLRELWLAGEKTEVIATMLGTTRGAVAAARRHFGLPRRPQNGGHIYTKPKALRLTSTELERAHRLWKLGYDTQDIANELGRRECEVYGDLAHYRNKLREEAA